MQDLIKNFFIGTSLDDLRPEQVALLFVILFGVLALVSVTVAVRSIARDDDEQMQRALQMRRDLRAVWIGAIVFWVSWISGPVGATLAFGVFSFLALREFITLAHTRRGDHRSLILAFFIVLPLQYLLVANRHFDVFSVFIPVYMFLAFPVLLPRLGFWPTLLASVVITLICFGLFALAVRRFGIELL